MNEKGKANGMYGVKRPNNAHFTGKSHSAKSKQKISNSLKKLDRGTEVTINGIKYSSLTEAQEMTNIPRSTISRNIGKTIIRKEKSFTIS